MSGHNLTSPTLPRLYWCAFPGSGEPFLAPPSTVPFDPSGGAIAGVPAEPFDPSG